MFQQTWDPLQYRRNAISIMPGENNVTENEARRSNWSKKDAIKVPGEENKERMMSVSDESEDPRLRRILSPFSVGKSEDENPGSRLTEAQVNAFKEVFDLFDSNGGGTIDAEELDLALQSVGIQLSQEDLVGVLEAMDKDGNGEIDFDEFLNLMTNTEKFLESFESQGTLEEENHRREVMLFEALTQFMKSSALHSMEEIVGYFHSRSKRSQAPHVVGHYAAGARLIGLTEKQLQQHLERIRASNTNSNSPYAQPIYNLIPSCGKERTQIGAPPPSNCLRAKKGKIKLKFQFNQIRSSEGGGKKDSRVWEALHIHRLNPPHNHDARVRPKN